MANYRSVEEDIGIAVKRKKGKSAENLGSTCTPQSTPPKKAEPPSASKTGAKKAKAIAGQSGSDGCGSNSEWLPKKAQHPLFGELYCVYAANKSYCVYKPDPDSPKQTLLVEVVNKKTPAHATTLRDLMLKSCTDGLNKAQTVMLRNSTVPSYQ